MPQINLHVKPDFERDLDDYMRLRGIRTKSEAIRVAVREGLRAARRARPSRTDFRAWVGAGLAVPPHPSPRFASDDDLWEPGRGR